MIGKSEDGLSLWRVGYQADPLGFTPRELYEFSHRFDDIHRRFRTLYCAERAETCLREVLADFRPNLGAQGRHIERYGPDAAQDFAKQPVTAQWRRQHVLIAALLRLDGPLIDLTDLATRQQIENRHAELLLEADLPHLDLHEITTSRRAVTQTIAADLYDHGASAVRFPSRLDGNACIALFEGARRNQVSGGPHRADRPSAGATHQRRYALGSRAGAHSRGRRRHLRRQPQSTRIGAALRAGWQAELARSRPSRRR